MRIVIDMLIAEKESDGPHLAVRTLLEELAHTNRANEYNIITAHPGDYQSLINSSNTFIYTVKPWFWKGLFVQHQLVLPNILQSIQPDVLHVSAFAAPIGWKGPLVMSISDTIFLKVLEHPSLCTRLYWQQLLQESVRRAQRIIVDSEQTRNKLISDWGVQLEHIGVVSPIEINANTIHRMYQEALDMYKQSLQIAMPSNRQSPQTAAEKVYPSVSIIVPVTNYVKALQTLESLLCQQYEGTTEIIVVGPIADELAQHCSVIPMNHELTRPAGKLRNFGVTQAKGDILLFLDDDMTVQQDWIYQSVQALQEPQVGAIGVRLPGKSSAFFSRCFDFTNLCYYQHHRVTDSPVASGCMGVFRSVFLAVNGFDTTHYSGEDMDLSYRIQELGYRTVYQPDIVAIHNHDYNTFGKLLRNNYTRGYTAGLRIKVEHRDSGLKNRLLYTVRFPSLFFLLIPAIAAAATIRIITLNVAKNRKVLLYAPFIYSAKIVYEFGVFQWLIRSKAKTKSS